jgi:hypothetical protein
VKISVLGLYFALLFAASAKGPPYPLTVAIPPEELQTGGTEVFATLNPANKKYPDLFKTNVHFDRIYINEPLDISLLGPGTNLIFVCDGLGNFAWAISNGRYDSKESNGRIDDASFPKVIAKPSDKKLDNGKYPWPMDKKGFYLPGNHLVTSNGFHIVMEHALAQLNNRNPNAKYVGGHVAIGRDHRAVIGYVSAGVNSSSELGDNRALAPGLRNILHDGLLKAFTGLDLDSTVASAPVGVDQNDTAAIKEKNAVRRYPKAHDVSPPTGNGQEFQFLPNPALQAVFKTPELLKKQSTEELEKLLSSYPHSEVAHNIFIAVNARADDTKTKPLALRSLDIMAKSGVLWESETFDRIIKNDTYQEAVFEHLITAAATNNEAAADIYFSHRELSEKYKSNPHFREKIRQLKSVDINLYFEIKNRQTTNPQDPELLSDHTIQTLREGMNSQNKRIRGMAFEAYAWVIANDKKDSSHLELAIDNLKSGPGETAIRDLKNIFRGTAEKTRFYSPDVLDLIEKHFDSDGVALLTELILAQPRQDRPLEMFTKLGLQSADSVVANSAFFDLDAMLKDPRANGLHFDALVTALTSTQAATRARAQSFLESKLDTSTTFHRNLIAALQRAGIKVPPSGALTALVLRNPHDTEMLKLLEDHLRGEYRSWGWTSTNTRKQSYGWATLVAALQSDPDNASLQKLFLDSLQSDQLRTREAAFEAYAELVPSLPDGNNLLSNESLNLLERGLENQRNEREFALKTLAAVAKRNPNNPDVYKHLGKFIEGNANRKIESSQLGDFLALDVNVETARSEEYVTMVEYAATSGFYEPTKLAAVECIARNLEKDPNNEELAAALQTILLKHYSNDIRIRQKALHLVETMANREPPPDWIFTPELPGYLSTLHDTDVESETAWIKVQQALAKARPNDLAVQNLLTSRASRYPSPGVFQALHESKQSAESMRSPLQYGLWSHDAATVSAAEGVLLSIVENNADSEPLVKMVADSMRSEKQSESKEEENLASKILDIELGQHRRISTSLIGAVKESMGSENLHKRQFATKMLQRMIVAQPENLNLSDALLEALGSYGSHRREQGFEVLRNVVGDVDSHVFYSKPYLDQIAGALRYNLRESEFAYQALAKMERTPEVSKLIEQNKETTLGKKYLVVTKVEKQQPLSRMQRVGACLKKLMKR